MRTLLILLVSFFIFSGCATKSVENPSDQTTDALVVSSSDDFDDDFDDFDDASFEIKKVYDPLSGYNRFMTGFNDKFFVYVLDPVASAYDYVVNKEIRESIKNFFHNLLYPVRAVNNLLQLKFKNTLEETGRFAINSTIGLLGLFDPAKSWFDLEAHEEDFGQTLGHYGVGSGFHIVLPFLGPSNLRDALSLYADAYVDPIYYYKDRSYNLLENGETAIFIKSYDIVNDESLQLGDYKMLKEDAVDLYTYLRDIYEQNRDKKIKE